MALDEEPTRILIVDDEARNVKALCSALQFAGYEVKGFTDASSALAELHESKYALLLADLRMPVMDGIELLRTSGEIDPEMVGIIMTGHGTIDSAVAAMKAGALDYVLKPFKFDAVLSVVDRALGVRKLRMENAELQRRIRERTAELEAANEELEAFSFSVSHDLRSPLTVIKGGAEFLLRFHDEELNDEVLELVRATHNASVKMSRLIDDLLRLSRLGRQTISREHVKIPDLVGEVVKDLRDAEPAREIEIRIGELADAHGDAGLLRQVFVNLISNAFKFTRTKRNAEIEIGSNKVEGESVFFVRDNGAGFEMGDAARLFDAFERLHKATNSRERVLAFP
jgi:signal transduction histidine kinase